MGPKKTGAEILPRNDEAASKTASAGSGVVVRRASKAASIPRVNPRPLTTVAALENRSLRKKECTAEPAAGTVGAAGR